MPSDAAAVMSSRTLITAAELAAALASAQPPVVLDCSFELSDPDAGHRSFLAGHLPGARCVHLDHDLAGVKTGRNGRHPLPEVADLAATVGRWGVRPGVPVVCYDIQGGPYAARAWWLLRWLGHHDVAVLDGGLAAWRAAGGAVQLGDAAAAAALPPYPLSAAFAAAMTTIDAPTLLADLAAFRIIDARAGERFRGEVEPLDPVAGHIPGARLRFFKDNLQADGRFKPPGQLRAEFEALGLADCRVVHQCGSGVTACHNLLAMAHAGLGDTALYPGSWSEWCSDPARPVARG